MNKTTQSFSQQQKQTQDFIQKEILNNSNNEQIQKLLTPEKINQYHNKNTLSLTNSKYYVSPNGFLNDNLSTKSKKSINSQLSQNYSSSKKRKVVFIKGKGLCLKQQQDLAELVKNHQNLRKVEEHFRSTYSMDFKQYQLKLMQQMIGQAKYGNHAKFLLNSPMNKNQINNSTSENNMRKSLGEFPLTEQLNQQRQQIGSSFMDKAQMRQNLIINKYKNMLNSSQMDKYSQYKEKISMQLPLPQQQISIKPLDLYQSQEEQEQANNFNQSFQEQLLKQEDEQQQKQLQIATSQKKDQQIQNQQQVLDQENIKDQNNNNNENNNKGNEQQQQAVLETMSNNKSEIKYPLINNPGQLDEFDCISRVSHTQEDEPLSNTAQGLMNENILYYLHLLGKCKCFVCSCGKCKCPYFKLSKFQVNYPVGGSIYARQYISPQSRQIAGSDVNLSKIISSLQYPHTGQQQISQSSCYKDDFIELNKNNQDKTLKNKPLLKGIGNHNSMSPQQTLNQTAKSSQTNNEVLLVKKSAYQKDFINFGANPNNNVSKRGQQLHVISQLPFNVQNSTYKNDFYNHGAGGMMDFRNFKKVANPMDYHDVPFQGNSTSKYNFQKYNPESYQQAIANLDLINPMHKKADKFLPSFEGQYKSVSKDFNIKSQNQCPAANIDIQEQIKELQEMQKLVVDQEKAQQQSMYRNNSFQNFLK